MHDNYRLGHKYVSVAAAASFDDLLTLTRWSFRATQLGQPCLLPGYSPLSLELQRCAFHWLSHAQPDRKHKSPVL